MTAAGSEANRARARRLWPALLAVLVVALMSAPVAHAERALLPFSLNTKNVPGGQIEGACGVAASATILYVSDYYHHAVDVFDVIGGSYQSRILANPLDGPCGLATSASGALYANDWHERVSRLLPSTLAFGPVESHATGVAVDQTSGEVYVDDRTHVAVYEPSGAFVMDVGAGTLEDAYGVAVFAGKVYVPDAGDGTIKVFEPAVDPDNPSSVIAGAALPGGGFNSLVDATVAVDPSNGHVLVVDNLQPGFEHPEAVIDEFGPAGEFLGALGKRIVDGEPSGLTFGAGKLFATTGNDEEANVVAFGAYVAGGSGFAASPPALVTAAAETQPESASMAAASPIVAAPELRLIASRPAVAGPAATLRAVVSSPGSLSVSGVGLRPARPLHVAAGAHSLHLRLDDAARGALARSKLHRLAVRVGIVFTPDVGNPVGARRTVTFRQPSRGN